MRAPERSPCGPRWQPVEPTDAERVAELEAVVQRVKSYISVMTHDKRMRVMADILLREIDRIEEEEAAKTARGGRR